MDPPELPPLPEPHLVDHAKGDFGYTEEQLREYALEAVRRERERLSLPRSYGGSTFDVWSGNAKGCTVRIHFSDADEGESWFNRLTDDWDRSRSQETSNAPTVATLPVGELVSLRRDAARYRWLREQDWFEGQLCVLRDPKRVLTRGVGLGADCPSRDRLDAAIDAAIRARSQEGDGAIK